MRYRLRTLLIVLALGPLVIAAGWWGYGEWRAERERQRYLKNQIELFGRPPADPATHNAP